MFCSAEYFFLSEIRFATFVLQVRVPFPWFDIFKTNRIDSYSMFYEQANMLFNVAAVYSGIAAVQNTALDEGLKLAAGYFQVSVREKKINSIAIFYVSSPICVRVCSSFVGDFRKQPAFSSA